MQTLELSNHYTSPIVTTSMAPISGLIIIIKHGNREIIQRIEMARNVAGITNKKGHQPYNQKDSSLTTMETRIGGRIAMMVKIDHLLVL